MAVTTLVEGALTWKRRRALCCVVPVASHRDTAIFESEAGAKFW
jgi:hypothetical protein